jgi:hypothetical protein
MVMVKCPQTGHAIPTGIQTDRESFGRCAVFFARTRCPLCRTEHGWFAREAWVDEPGIRVRHRNALASTPIKRGLLTVMEGDNGAHENLD